MTPGESKYNAIDVGRNLLELVKLEYAMKKHFVYADDKYQNAASPRHRAHPVARAVYVYYPAVAGQSVRASEEEIGRVLVVTCAHFFLRRKIGPPMLKDRAASRLERINRSYFPHRDGARNADARAVRY